jgi:hypothetical protein
MENKRQRRKMLFPYRLERPCFYRDRPCHSAVAKFSHERACLARMDEDNSTNPLTLSTDRL